MSFIYAENKRRYGHREVSQDTSKLCDRVLNAFKQKAFPESELERHFGHPFFKSPYQMPIAGEMMDRMRASRLFERYVSIIDPDSATIEWESYEVNVRGQRDTMPLVYCIGLPISHGFSTIFGKMPALDLTPLDKLSLDETVTLSGISTDGKIYFVDLPCYLRDNFAINTDTHHHYRKVDLLLAQLKNKLGMAINGYTERIDRRIGVKIKKIKDEILRDALGMLKV